MTGHCDPYDKNRSDFEQNENSNVFIIMRYANEFPLLEVENAIKRSGTGSHLDRLSENTNSQGRKKEVYFVK